MAYSLCSENGFVGSLASIEGYGDMISAANQSLGVYALKEFFARGVTKNPAQVIRDIDSLVASSMDSEVRHSFMNLKSLLAKVREVGIVYG